MRGENNMLRHHWSRPNTSTDEAEEEAVDVSAGVSTAECIHSDGISYLGHCCPRGEQLVCDSAAPNKLLL